MRKWTVEKGIILIEIQEVFFLAADKEARKICPYVREINEIGAFIWKMLEEKKEPDEIILMLKEEYEVSGEHDLEMDVYEFLKTLKENHYLTDEAEENEV